MPLFEYECLVCHARIEEMQRSGARPLKKAECERCGEIRPVKKLVSSPAFQFKGEGWYVTDYKKGGADKGAESSGEESSAGGEGKASADSDKGSSTESAADAGTDKAAKTDAKSSESEPKSRAPSAKKDGSSDKNSGSAKAAKD